jgi:hypothetical protein
MENLRFGEETYSFRIKLGLDSRCHDPWSRVFFNYVMLPMRVTIKGKEINMFLKENQQQI